MALSQFIKRSWAVPPDIVAMKFSPNRTPRVLCATDLGVGSDAALSRAREIARALVAQVLLLHVVDLASTARATGRRRARTQLTIDALSRKIAWPGSDVQGSVRASRRPYRAIADVAIEWDADLIVLGPYRRRLGDSFRGTTAERVIRKADRPVLVVNRDAAGPYEHVLLASDLSRMSANIARVAKQFGLLEGSRTSVVHAPQHSPGLMLYLARGSASAVSNDQRSRSRFASKQIEAQLERAGLNGARVSVFPPQTSPFHAIEQVAQRVGSDLVVVGSSRFPLLKRLFIGSVSNEVLRGMKHDVLIVSPAAARRARRRALTMDNASVQSAGELEEGGEEAFDTSCDELWIGMSLRILPRQHEPRPDCQDLQRLELSDCPTVSGRACCGESLKRSRRYPQMYPQEAVAADGFWWTFVDEMRTHRVMWLRSAALHVYGRLRTSALPD